MKLQTDWLASVKPMPLQLYCADTKNLAKKNIWEKKTDSLNDSSEGIRLTLMVLPWEFEIWSAQPAPHRTSQSLHSPASPTRKSIGREDLCSSTYSMTPGTQKLIVSVTGA